MKLQIFAESPEYQEVTSEVQKFSSEYPELQNTSQQEIPPYFIEILVSPALFDGVNDTILLNFLQKRIDKDTTWTLAGGLTNKEKKIPLLGSWTSFQKETSIEYMKKSKINYLPTIPKSLEYPVCKISTFIRHYRSSEIPVHICTSIWDFTYNMDAQRFLFKNNSYYGRFSSNACFFKEFFSNVTTVWVYKISLLIPKQLLPEQLSMRLKGDFITVECTYIKKGLMLLLREKSKILQVNLSLYLQTFLIISQNSGKVLQ